MAPEVLNEHQPPAGAVPGPHPPAGVLPDDEVAAFAISNGLDPTGMKLMDAGTNRLYRLADREGQVVWLKCGARRRDREGDLLAEGLFYLGSQMAKLEIPVPRAVLHDRERDVLVTRDMPGTAGRKILDSLTTDTSEAVLHALGDSLAQIHSSINADPVRKMLSRQLDCPLPFIAPLSTLEYANQSIGSLHLLRTIYADSQWRQKLELLQGGWRCSVPIHGDFRSDNLLFDLEYGVNVLDWEYARMGDPLYDVGMFMADRLEHSVGATLRAAQGRDVSARDLVWESLSSALKQIRPFWFGYSERSAALADADKVVVWAMAGAGLLHRVFGASLMRQRLAKQDFTMLSLARTLTISPNRFAKGLTP